tara:strand:+ start:1738 stop:2286 length:549 start_codon:yes stop_codon:yes gene_type:complete
MSKLRVLFFLLFIFSCGENNIPKPRAYFKLNLPEKNYKIYNTSCKYSFMLPTYSKLNQDFDCDKQNIYFPKQDAILHLSYFKIKNNLFQHLEESRSLAYKHQIIADGINEQVFVNDSLKVYGVLYDYDGVTATSIQFCLTDSINHFFRGALYFNTEINDSIAPLNTFLKKDMRYLIETFSWK